MFVLIQSYNLLSAVVGDDTQEVSFDGGKSFRAVTKAERVNGVEVAVEQKFTVRVSRPHHAPVVQPLLVTDLPSPPPGVPPQTQLTFDGPRDFGSLVASVKSGRGGTLTFQYTAFLTVFRDGDAPRAAAKNAAITPQFMFILAFQGARVLANGGTGYGRFNATIPPTLFAPTSSQGQLFFALGPDASVPQLVAIFVPNSVDLTQPVPLNIFFCPTTGEKEPPYPFSSVNADPTIKVGKDFDGVVTGFLTGFNRRLIHQHVTANKKCVLVFPLPPGAGYFSGIEDAERLRRYCLEIVFFAQRTVGNARFPNPQLGRCALTGFSSAGVPLSKVVSSSLKGAFPELKEIYCLDVVAPVGNSTDAASYQSLFANLGAWMKADSTRRVRIYTQSSAMNSVSDPLKGPRLGTNVGGTVEQGTANTTFAFMPPTFLLTVDQERVGTTPDPNYLLSAKPAPRNAPLPAVTKPMVDLLHNAFPSIFLEHALQCSGFA
jgi:hypothetical protein